MVVIIDASIVRRCFSDVVLFLKILTTNHVLKAPEKLVSEILGPRKRIMKEAAISLNAFYTIWRLLLGKIAIEQPNQEELKEAGLIMSSLDLDVKDISYLALCMRYIHLKPTFWTYESKFVKGESAQFLRDEYGIYCNFNI